MIDVSVQKMEWLIDHRHIVGLYNDQCNYQRPLPVDVHFITEVAADRRISSLTKAKFNFSRESPDLIRVQDCVYVAPTAGPMSYDLQSGRPVIRLMNANGSTEKISTDLIRSVVAKAPYRHYGFFHPLVNNDGTYRSEENVQAAYQLFSESANKTDNIIGKSQKFVAEWAI